MNNTLPLAGVKVLDLSRVLAGPYCTQILGDLGADVLKIEDPHSGDDTRQWAPPSFEGASTYFLSANRNKRSIALDFKNADDLARVKDLAATADVVIENFKVGSLKKFGLDSVSLRKEFPRLIYCSITGFGQDGPRAKEPGYDLLIQGMGGLMSITGPSSDHPTKSGMAIVDLCTGLYATIAILAALRERERSGLGQCCDLSLLDTSTSLLSYIAMNFLATKQNPVARGNTHPTIVPYQSFETKDRPLLITIGNDHQFVAFCECLEKPWAKDAKFATNEQREHHREELVELIQAELKRKTRAEWIEIFTGKGFPFGPINSLEELSRDPQMLFRQAFTVMSDQKTPCVRSPLRFDRTPLTTYTPPPALNEHASATWRD